MQCRSTHSMQGSKAVIWFNTVCSKSASYDISHQEAHHHRVLMAPTFFTISELFQQTISFAAAFFTFGGRIDNGWWFLLSFITCKLGLLLASLLTEWLAVCFMMHCLHTRVYCQNSDWNPLKCSTPHLLKKYSFLLHSFFKGVLSQWLQDGAWSCEPF